MAPSILPKCGGGNCPPLLRSLNRVHKIHTSMGTIIYESVWVNFLYKICFLNFCPIFAGSVLNMVFKIYEKIKVHVWLSGQGCTLDWIANLKFEYRPLKLISQLLRNAFMQKSFYVNLKHYPVWFFWIENILGYIREQFYRFSRGCKPRENLWNCIRKYTKMFKTDSFSDNTKLSLNQNV